MWGSYLRKAALLELGVESSSLVFHGGSAVDSVHVKNIELLAMLQLQTLEAGVDGRFDLGRLQRTVAIHAKDHDLGVDLETILWGAGFTQELLGSTDGRGRVQCSGVESGDVVCLKSFQELGDCIGCLELIANTGGAKDELGVSVSGHDGLDWGQWVM